MTTSRVHSVTIEVRDHECDLAGGLNNAVFFNYLEHGRHRFLKDYGIDFAKYAEKKMGMVLLRIEIDFKWSLYSGETCTVTTFIERLSPIRFQFTQEIVRNPDGKLILKAKSVGLTINEKGRPFIPPEFEAIIAANTPVAVESASLPRSDSPK